MRTLVCTRLLRSLLVIFVVVSPCIAPVLVAQGNQYAAVQKLTLSQIDGLIVSGVPDGTLSNQIRVHGVSFAVTPAVLAELRSKGAGPLVVAAVATFEQAGQTTHDTDERGEQPSASIKGRVVNRTTGGPAAGDAVILLNLPAMQSVSYASTGVDGGYEIGRPRNAPFLLEVIHQGVRYFAAVPETVRQIDVPVYDVGPKVDGVHIEADVIELEAEGVVLSVVERFFVHNKSSPPLTQWSPRSFEIVLPATADVREVTAQRPDGLPVTVILDPVGTVGRYSLNFPIMPDEGERDTMFLIRYTLPYSNEGLELISQRLMFAENVAVLLPKSMRFSAGVDSSFSPINSDPSVQTWLMKNIDANTTVSFTVFGTGEIPQH